MPQTFETQIGGRTLTIETGRLAGLAGGAVTVRYGDTMVLGTANRSEPRPGLDFFPLTVEFEERMYAAGKIPGGFFKREGKASERATLTARMIDRPIRPLWPKGFRNEVQVICTVLSADLENDSDTLAITGAAADPETISPKGIDGWEGKTILHRTKSLPQCAALLKVAPADLARIVRRCLAKDPEDRWQTARDLMRGRL